MVKTFKQPSRRKRKAIAVLTVLLLLGLICLTASIIFGGPAVTNYTISADILSPVRILHLSDLHNAEFGKNNKKLVNLAAKQAPDIIVMTGDMLNRDDDDIEIVCRLITELRPIAPVYFGYGNHEKEWEKTWKSNLADQFREAGAVIVDNSYEDIEINGVEVRIGGYMGYYRQPGMFQVTKEQRMAELAFADNFEDTERYKILLDHIPTAWLDWGYIDQYPVDLVLSGHYHGGQWVLPVIGAVYAPYIGFDPPYVRGLFTGTQAACVLSAGLGSEYTWLPRVNNPPELVVIDIVPEGS